MSQVKWLTETAALRREEQHNHEMLSMSVESAGRYGFVALYKAIEKSTSFSPLFKQIGLKKLREAMPDDVADVDDA